MDSKHDGINQSVRVFLLAQQDLEYKAFQGGLIPTVEQDRIIGVRTPLLRAYAKKLAKETDVELFLRDLPHTCFEENQLHAFVISLERDYAHLMEELTLFLPYIDNWATCDQLSPVLFKKQVYDLYERHITEWIHSAHTYTVRFAIGMLMQHYLDARFDLCYPQLVAEVRSDEYYVNMMIAWYFATALAKQYESVLPFLTEGKLELWTHNKTIQKAIESSRIPPQNKDELRALRRKGH